MLKLIMNFRITKAAIKVLQKELGWRTLLKLVGGLSKRKQQGEPWKGLPDVADNKDKESRQLIGDAILLYRELLNRLSQPDAERIIRMVIVESAVMQLYSLIPIISRREILDLPSQERKDRFCTIIDQFPNADWEIGKITEKEYVYFITRCRLVELIISVGHPELKDAFCNGDGVYFERHQPEITFKRPQKIGIDNPVCEFIFGLKEPNGKMEGKKK